MSAGGAAYAHAASRASNPEFRNRYFLGSHFAGVRLDGVVRRAAPAGHVFRPTKYIGRRRDLAWHGEEREIWEPRSSLTWRDHAPGLLLQRPPGRGGGHARRNSRGR
eukprot:scaffold94063_cov60-Phaeocystis_antarctica.AAC.4